MLTDSFPFPQTRPGRPIVAKLIAGQIARTNARNEWAVLAPMDLVIGIDTIKIDVELSAAALCAIWPSYADQDTEVIGTFVDRRLPMTGGEIPVWRRFVVHGLNTPGLPLDEALAAARDLEKRFEAHFASRPA